MPVISRSNRRLFAVLAVLATVASGCFYNQAFWLDQESGGTEVPWWCQGPPDLSSADCLMFSAHLDQALDYADDYRTLSDFTTAGATEVVSRPADAGVPYALPGCCAAFDPATPSLLLYDGTAGTSRLVGVGWGVDGAEPAGFTGSRDVWTQVGARWFLFAWIVQGYENDPNVFATSHPCLTGGAVLTSTTDACYVASHTLDYEILVTNDDGIDADGIDAIVEALRVLPGVDVTVVAPATQQSGSGDSTTPGPVTVSAGATASGYPGTAVNGTPGDSVIYAIDELYLQPDLIVSGINEGQNMFAPIVAVSGTVGAAKWGGRHHVPSIATSQGDGPGIILDYPAGVTATLEVVEDVRLGLRGLDETVLTNVNTPSCTFGGTIRGTIDTVVASSLNGRSYTAQDCLSTETVINDDVDAFNHGFVGITEIPARP